MCTPTLKQDKIQMWQHKLVGVWCVVTKNSVLYLRSVQSLLWCRGVEPGRRRSHHSQLCWLDHPHQRRSAETLWSKPPSGSPGDQHTQVSFLLQCHNKSYNAVKVNSEPTWWNTYCCTIIPTNLKSALLYFIQKFKWHAKINCQNKTHVYIYKTLMPQPRWAVLFHYFSLI